MKNLFYTRPVLHGKRCNMILSSRTATSVITSIERKRDIDIDIDVDRKKKEKERERETVLSESEIGSSVTWTLGVRRELAAGLDRTHDSYFYKQYIYNIYIHIFIYRYPFFFLKLVRAFLISFLFFFFWNYSFGNYMDRLSQQDFFSCVSQAWFRGRLRSAGIISDVVDDFYFYFSKKNSFFNISSVEFFFFISFFLSKKKRWFKSYSKVYRDFRRSLFFFFFGFFKIFKRREVEWEKRNVAELNPRARGLTVSSGPISSSKAFSLLPAPSSPCQSTCLSDFLRSATDFHDFSSHLSLSTLSLKTLCRTGCDGVCSCRVFHDENRIAFENSDT